LLTQFREKGADKSLIVVPELRQCGECDECGKCGFSAAELSICNY
jgi:hypothetical protein